MSEHFFIAPSRSPSRSPSWASLGPRLGRRAEKRSARAGGAAGVAVMLAAAGAAAREEDFGADIEAAGSLDDILAFAALCAETAAANIADEAHAMHEGLERAHHFIEAAFASRFQSPFGGIGHEGHDEAHETATPAGHAAHSDVLDIDVAILSVHSAHDARHDSGHGAHGDAAAGFGAPGASEHAGPSDHAGSDHVGHGGGARVAREESFGHEASAGTGHAGHGTLQLAASAPPPAALPQAGGERDLALVLEDFLGLPTPKASPAPMLDHSAHLDDADAALPELPALPAEV